MILGEAVYYSIYQNGTTVYTVVPWAGNFVPTYTPITKEQYIAGLQSKIQEAKNFMRDWHQTIPGNLSYYNSKGDQYSGPTYNQASIDEYLRLIDQAKNYNQKLIGQNAGNLQIPDLLEKGSDLKLAANAALNDFLSKQRSNIDVAARLSTKFMDESGNLIQTRAQQFVIDFNAPKGPKYKTILPKFVILDIYDMKGDRRGAKIGEALIGLVNSLEYTPTTEELNTLGASII